MEIINILSVASVFKTVWSVMLALLILLLMITVHEFGHYIAGKIFKFKINEFAIGFGPAIYKRKRKSDGEVFSIRAFPLGGYCAFEGEDEENTHKDAFNNKKPWQRIIVLISGAFMNYITALIIILIAYFSFGQLLLYVGGVQAVEDVNSNYSIYSFQEKDIILKVEGKNVFLTSDIMEVVKNKKQDDLINFKVSRKTGNVREIVDIQVALRTDPNIKNLTSNNPLFESLGLSTNGNGNYLMYTVPLKFGFFETIGRAFVYTARIAGTIFIVLGQLITGALGISALSGPVSTIAATSKIASASLHSFLEIAAFIGINLAVFNLLPLPALDGSKVVFTGIEWATKKPINRKVEAVISFLGLIFLLGFAILVDVAKLF